MTTKQVCGMFGCEWHGSSDDVLKAPNPFDFGEVLWACPSCKGINALYLACDEDGCWEMSACGTPTETGYRSTCGKHLPTNTGNKS